MIIIVAAHDDIHARVVEKRLLDRGAQVRIIYPSDYPQRCGISYFSGLEGSTFELQDQNGKIEAGSVTGVWNRRRHTHDLSPELENRSLRGFAYEQSNNIFSSFIQCCAPENQINQFGADALADNKAAQLAVAASCGLTVPRTLITNEVAVARRFAKSIRSGGGDVVFKSPVSPRFQVSPTMQLEESDWPLLESVSHAPVIFQEKISVAQHWRVTFIDKEIFPAKITANEEKNHIDWRLDAAAKVVAGDLDKDVAKSCFNLMKALNLRYGAFDIIETPTGEFVFLEVNPGGQFLFVESEADLPISDALAKALLIQA